MTVEWKGVCCRVSVLSSLLVIAALGPARAATPVFVDSAGMCAGLTPCFTTIQAGVNNAGPPPAVVNVFPGTYAESVDLSLMNGGSPGTLTLRTVNGAGAPTPGTASILPATGAALRNSVSPFTGNLTIAGFTVQSPDSDGIIFSVIQGDLNLSGVVSDGNGGSGMEVDIQGSVLITDSSFSNNLNGFGMSFDTAVDVTFGRVNVDGNKTFNASFSLTGAVRITDSSFSNSPDGFGLSFATATDATLIRVMANGNNGFNTSFSLTGALLITDSSFSNSANGFGLSFATAADATLDGVTANGNNGFNTSFSLTGTVRIADSSFSNSATGFGLSFATATDVTLTRVIANGNQGFNTSFSVTGVLLITDSSFSDSATGFGLSFASATNATLERVTADHNDSFNGSFSVDGTIAIEQSRFSASVTNFGLSVSSPVNLILTSVVVDGNATNGLLAGMTNATIRGSEFVKNGLDGVRLAPAEPDGILRLSCNDIAENQRNGLVLLNAATVDAEQNYWGAPSGPTHPSNPGGTGDTVVDGANGGAGTVDFEPFLTVPSADSTVCHPHGAPTLGAGALAVLLIALLILPAWRLSRRDAA